MEGARDPKTYTEAQDIISDRVRKGHKWFYAGVADAKIMLAGKTGYRHGETLELIRLKWNETAVDEYERGFNLEMQKNT